MDRMYVKGGTSLTPMLSISNHLWWSTGSTLSQHTECKLLCLFTVQWRIQSISSRTDPLFCEFFAKKNYEIDKNFVQCEWGASISVNTVDCILNDH